MTLIELDLRSPPDPDAVHRPPPWRYRHIGLLAALALLAVLGGAAPHSGTIWRYLGAVPPSAGLEAPIQLAGGRLYTVASAGRQRTLSAWTLRPAPRRVWTSEMPVSADYDPGRGLFGLVTVRQAGEVLLLSEGLATTALDPETGRIRWSTPVRVWAGADDTGLAVERIFRPGTLYDQESGDPGTLYFSADGQPHTEPPVRTEVRGLDLTTGAVRWTVAPPGSVTADVLPGNTPAVLITASDRLTLLDGRTGALLREAALPELDGAGPSTAELLGDVALVGYQKAGRQAGYDARTLEQLWTRPLIAGADGSDCVGLLCVGDRDELRVLDPRTGRTAWTTRAGDDLKVRAGFVMQTEERSGAPVRLVDARTGAQAVDLAAWRAEIDGSSERALLLRRDDRSGGQAFGIVLPGHPQVRVLGVADTGGGDCGGDDRYVVCRGTQGLRIWAYRI